LGLNNSIPILLGDNIGTTITALLATLGQSKNAKRTAAAHSVFNISGSLIFLCVIPYFADFIRFISPTGAEVDVIARQIANAHTAFNIINTIIWLPFIWLMVKIVMWLVPGEDKAVKHEESKPKYLDDKLISQPAIALHMAALEIMRCGVTGEEAIRDLKSAMINNNRESLEKIARSIVGIHLLQEKIAHYISSMLSSGSLTHEQARQTAGLMHMISDIGRISNRCKEILEIATEKMSGEHFFSSRANKELGEGFDLIAKMLGKSLTALSLGAKPMAEEVMEQRDTVSALEMKLRNKHLLKLELGDSNEQKAQMFISSMHNIERIGYHCLNLSESVLDGIDMTFLIKNRADYDEVAE
jgi:phosphate:Na+ symporter